MIKGLTKGAIWRSIASAVVMAGGVRERFGDVSGDGRGLNVGRVGKGRGKDRIEMENGLGLG